MTPSCDSHPAFFCPWEDPGMGLTCFGMVMRHLAVSGLYRWG